MSKGDLRYLKTFESFLLEALSEDKDVLRLDGSEEYNRYANKYAKIIADNLISALSNTWNDDEKEALEAIKKIKNAVLPEDYKIMLDIVSDEVKKQKNMDLPTYINSEMSDVDHEYKEIFDYFKEHHPEMAKKYKENKFLQKAGKALDYIQDFNWENFLVDLYGLGVKILTKILGWIVKTYQRFKHWREENPNKWKLIVVILLVFVFIFIFAYAAYSRKVGGKVPKFNIDPKDLLTSVKGAKDGPPIKNEGLDAAIGVLQKMKETDVEKDQFNSMHRAMAYLIELKKGNQIKLDAAAKSEVKKAMDMVKDYYDKAQDVHPNFTRSMGEDGTYIGELKKFAKAGAEYIDTHWEKLKYFTSDGKYSGSSEKIGLVTKTAVKNAFVNAMEQPMTGIPVESIPK